MVESYTIMPNKNYLATTIWDRKRNRQFTRARCQAKFRGETWLLTYTDWCEFFPTEQSVNQIGRGRDNHCLTRLDIEGAWDRDNTCLISRLVHLQIKNRRSHGLPWEHLMASATWITDVQ